VWVKVVGVYLEPSVWACVLGHKVFCVQSRGKMHNSLVLQHQLPRTHKLVYSNHFRLGKHIKACLHCIVRVRKGAYRLTVPYLLGLLDLKLQGSQEVNPLV